MIGFLAALLTLVLPAVTQAAERPASDEVLASIPETLRFATAQYEHLLTSLKGTTNLPPELSLNARVAPTFIAQTQDDSVPVEGSLFYYAGLKQAKVPAEMHLFAQGGHGYGLRPTAQPIIGWPKLAEAWMRDLGILEVRK